MIVFWAAAGLLLCATLAALLWPLFRNGAGSGDREAIVAAFRQRLVEIEAERAAGTLAPDDAAAAHAEITRSMLAAVDRAERTGSGKSGAERDAALRTGAVAAIAALIPAGGLAVYLAIGMPSAIGLGQPGIVAAENALSPHDSEMLTQGVGKLRARIEKEPGDLKAWTLLGRTLLALGRMPEARDAYAHAVALAPEDAELHSQLGELLLSEADGAMTPAAEAEFARAGDDPRARYYRAEAALQRGDLAAGTKGLADLLSDSPADAPWREMVASRLQAVAPGMALPPGKPPVASTLSAPPPGPSAADVAAAQAMSPADQQAMIRGMVERLAARLDANPGDKEGWARLAHAYDVLGETEKAQGARNRAAAAPDGPAAPSR